MLTLLVCKAKRDKAFLVVSVFVFSVFLKWTLDGIQIFFTDPTLIATDLQFQGSCFIFVQLEILILVISVFNLKWRKLFRARYGILSFILRVSTYYTSIIGVELLTHLAINNYLILTQDINYLIYTLLCYLRVFLSLILFTRLFFIKRFDTFILAITVITTGTLSLHLLTVYYLCWYYIWEITITLTIWKVISFWFSTLLIYILILALILFIIKKILQIFK